MNDRNDEKSGKTMAEKQNNNQGVQLIHVAIDQQSI